MNLIAFATENYCNHILLPYSYSLYQPKSHALMEYNGGLEKAILRDSELLSEVNDAFCKSHPLLAIWRNERSRKLRFVNFWISFRGTFHRECMAFLQT